MQELRGIPVAQAITEQLKVKIDDLSKKGILPKLSIIRVGSREDDIAYEKGITKRFALVNAAVEIIELSFDVNQDELEEKIISLNQDQTVHGILIFRPLPKHLSEERIKSIIAAEKDVDGMSTINTASIFAGNKKGFPPCTPQAVIEVLDFYGIDVTGKKVTIVGRSLVVGKPLAMLLLDKNATVTICHTRTVNLEKECRNSDILIACAGVARIITKDFTNPDQLVIDVGINMVAGKLCGDVNYDEVADKVKAITPVPGGIGSVTTSVLLKHTIKSAELL